MKNSKIGIISTKKTNLQKKTKNDFLLEHHIEQNTPKTETLSLNSNLSFSAPIIIENNIQNLENLVNLYKQNTETIHLIFVEFLEEQIDLFQKGHLSFLEFNLNMQKLIEQNLCILNKLNKQSK